MNIHVITGGGSGIGLETAKRFKEGMVVITGRNEEKLKNAVSELESKGVSAKYFIADISNRDSIKELFNFSKSLGKIKTVLNSAGVSGDGTTVEKTLKIDLIGTEFLIEEFYEVMEENAVLILISSMMAQAVPVNPDYDELLVEPSKEGNLEKIAVYLNDSTSNAYNFSKRGVNLLVKKNVERYGKKGCRIVSVSPGIILTPMAKIAAKEHPEQMKFMETITPIQRNGKPEDIANMVEFLASDKASFITGTDFLVDGGLHLNLYKLAQLK